MFKQPAENTNATAAEEKDALERVRPLARDTTAERERIDELAQRLASESGKDDAGPEEVGRAKEVIENRRNVEAKP